MTTIVTIDMGGTGATHAAGAREALSVPSMTDMGAAYAQANAAYAAANAASGVGGGGYDQANAAYAQANTARTTANNAYDQANNAYDQANTARSDANTTFGTINTTFGTVNTSLGTINTNYQAAYSQANTARDTANLAYEAANNSNLKLGGLISGTLNVTQDLIVGGNIYLEGNTTYINVATYSVEDALIYLSSNNKLTDSVDIGFMGGKNSSGTYAHTGLARDATDGKWKLFDGLAEEGHVGNVVDFANTYLATLVANVEANSITVLGNAVATATNTAAAYTQANAAYGQANTARSDANTTFATVNTTFGTINTSLGTINTSYQAAYAQANTARTTANDAYGQANAAYGAANNRVLKAGDTMTGALIINPSTGGSNVIRVGVASQEQFYIEAGITSITNSALLVKQDNGYNYLTLRANNVGIGTTNPGAKLQIQADGIGLRLDGTPDTTRTIFLRNTTVTNPAQIYSDGSLRLYTEDAGTDIRFHTVSNGTTNERMRISPAGTVGIGLTPYDTNSATYRLQLYADSQCFMSFGNSTTGAGNDQGLTVGCDSTGADIYQRENAPLRFHTYDIERMRIAANGNVGIGTTNPYSKLHITGDVTFGSGSSARPGFKITNWGYSASYRALLIGSSNTSYSTANTGAVTIAFNYDPSINANGSFTGDGREIVFRRGTRFVTPNSGDTGFNLTNLVLYDGNVGIGTDTPGDSLHINGGNAVRIKNSSTYARLDLGTADNQFLVQVEDSTFDGIGIYQVAPVGGAGWKAVLNTSGNLGIGTTSPSYVLSTSSSAHGQYSQHRQSSGGGVGQEMYYMFNNASGTPVNYASIYTEISSSTAGSHGGILGLRVASSGSLTTAITIASTTNVGISTASPRKKLDVVGTVYIEGGSANWSESTPGTTVGSIHLDPGSTTDNFGSAITWGASDQSSGEDAQAGIYVRSDGSYGTKMYFATTDSYATGSKVAVTIDHSKNVTVGGTLTESSSVTIKENINPIKDALNLISSINGYTYDRKDGSAKNRPGLLAEEVNEVLPNVVMKDEEGNPSSISYTNLIAYLIESIKELKAEIDELKGK